MALFTQYTGIDYSGVEPPTAIDLDTRAERINQFWHALVVYQHRDVLVVAMCVGDER